MPDFTAILERLVPRLDEYGVRYALIGGLAVSAHGCIRDTHDLDFLVRASDLPAFERAARETGYELASRGESMSYFELLGAGLAPLDALHAERPTTLAMLERARAVPIGRRGIEARIVEAEDLIGLKAYAIHNNPRRRGKDWPDISMLAKRFRDTLDWDRVRAYFATFGMDRDYDVLRSEIDEP